MSRITLNDISLQLEEEGWKVLSSEYVNLKTEMEFECNEGHKVFTSWEKLRRKLECPICKQNKYKEIKPLLHKKKKGENRILALDQATRITGYSVFDGTELVKFGTFVADSDESEANRIHQVKEWFVSMVENYDPDLVGIEGIQYEQNFGVTTFQSLARLQGVLVEACVERGLPFQICATNTWRAHCGVKGRTRSDKKQSMQQLVKEWFDISISDDESDAIGIGKFVSDGHLKKTEVVSWE